MKFSDITQHLGVRGFVTRESWGQKAVLHFGMDNTGWYTTVDGEKGPWTPCVDDMWGTDWIMLPCTWNGSKDDMAPFKLSKPWPTLAEEDEQPVPSRSYLANGEEVWIVGTLDDGRLAIASILEDPETGEEYEGRATIVEKNELFDKCPRSKKDETIKKLTLEINELTQKRNELRMELKDIELNQADRLAVCQQHKGLESLEKFLKGEITHYVELRYGDAKIIPFEDAVADIERTERRDNLKLLSLFGGTKGDLTWKLNRYSDGSGCYTDITPCTSLEDAIRIIEEWLLTTVAEQLANWNDASGMAKSSKVPTQKIVKIADEYGISIPDEYRAAVKTLSIASRKRELLSVREKLRIAEEAWEAECAIDAEHEAVSAEETDLGI